ncbi:MAG TPA: Ig-like domain-containing protein, partial [bacterium]|nr:Ig-like domain-containing protein [bacterium]
KGQYEIRGIWYDATIDQSTIYTVTPYKHNHTTFTPASKDVGLNRTSPQADDVKFLDESLFTVSGAITYDGTNCPVVNAEILVDSSSNRPEIFTDDQGKFSIDFEPNTGGVLTVRFGGLFVYDTLATNNIDTQYVDGHTFNLNGVEQGYRVENIQTDIAGVDFTNVHTESLSGIVGGGKCLFPIGDVEIKLQTTPSCYERIDTVASGQEFTIDNLPPLDYNIIITRLDWDSTFYSGTLSLRDSSLTDQKYIYKAPLEVDFVGLPTNSCGINVVEQFKTDSVYIQVFEDYGGNKCFLDQIHIEVNDEFTEKSYEDSGPLDSEGKNVIYFTPTEPNILSGGEHPYQKKLEVTVTDEIGRKATNSFYSIITGEKKSENNQFTTSTSRMPWFVLRNPPGDGSYTYFTDQQEITTNLSIYKTDSEGNQGTETLHLGWDKTVVSGFGLQVETKWSLELDAGHGWNVTKSDVDIDETSLTFTRSETYSTSSDELVTGDEASVFVGGGLTVTFGIATKLSVDETSCEVQLDTTLVGDLKGFNSTYMFSKYYIKNDLIPNLRMQWRVDGDSSALKSLNYWETILQKDSVAVANARDHDAFKIGTQQESSNISYDAGVSYEYMTSTDSSFTNGTQVTVEKSHEAFGSAGFTVDAFGYTNTYAHTWYDAKDTTETETETNTRTIGFVLDDNDPGDAFNFDVLRDTVWGMPVFITKAGQSSRPWEEGTMKRQNAQLSVNPIVQEDVEPDQEAVYTVNLGNLSETGETWSYNLSLLNETNPYGAIVKVNGNNLGSSGVDFEIEAGTSMDATMTIERGPVEYDYEDLTLMLASPGEIEIADNLGTNPQNADFAAVTTYFIEPCSGVRIASSDEDWLINQKSGDSLVVTLRDFDTTDTELQRLALEYSKVGEDTWLIADTVSMDSVLKLGNDYQKITWHVDKIDDGNYDLRAKTDCRLRNGYSQLYRGLIDRRSPQIEGVPTPEDKTLHPNDQISITLDEPINCDEIYPSTGELYFANSGDEIACELSCNENTLTITPATSVSNREIENKSLRAEVHFLKDLAGNNMNVDTLGWEFVVDRNPIHWNVNQHEQVVYIGEETVIPIELNNNGGEEMSFEFGKNAPIPDWLTISPMYGDVNPGGNLTIYLHVDPYLNLGHYNETIYAETP